MKTNVANFNLNVNTRLVFTTVISAVAELNAHITKAYSYIYLLYILAFL